MACGMNIQQESFFAIAKWLQRKAKYQCSRLDGDWLLFGKPAHMPFGTARPARSTQTPKHNSVNKLANRFTGYDMYATIG